MMCLYFFFQFFCTSLPMQNYKNETAKNTPKKGFYLADG